MPTVLFICTGNTCRSPMAEFLFNHLASKRGSDWLASSAGIFAREGGAPTPEALMALQKLYGIEASSYRSRSLRLEMIKEATLVLTMTREQADYLRRLWPSEQQKIHTLGQTVGMDIDDPYGGDAALYERTLRQITTAIDSWWPWLSREFSDISHSE